MASLGERFIYYRIASDRDARVEQGTAALENIGMVSGMRDELSEAIRDLFDPFPTIPAADFRSAQHREQIVALANLATMARSAVERERYTHEIALVPEPESPTRFSISLSLLFRGMRAIGLEDREAWAVVRKVALDSIPPIRRAALNMLLSVQGPMEMEALKVRAGLKCSSSTLRRALEDLEAHSVVQFVRGDKNKTLWSVTGWAREQHRKGTK
jgi:hypothetical protein